MVQLFFFFTSALINKLDTDIKETIESFDINRSRTAIIDNIHWYYDKLVELQKQLEPKAKGHLDFFL